MDDRELLELAARAAGIGGGWGDKVDYHSGEVDLAGYWILDAEEMTFWDPLIDDGDALRLAVKLGFRLELDNAWRRSHAQQMPSGPWVTGYHNDDPMKGTRRAIVIAAAEIGKAMQENS